MRYRYTVHHLGRDYFGIYDTRNDVYVGTTYLRDARVRAQDTADELNKEAGYQG